MTSSIVFPDPDAPDIGTGGQASSIPAVILAGGRGIRMGGVDKPLLMLAGRPVLDHVLARLRPQVGRLALNANGDPARFAAWDLPVLADPRADQPGPLAGILAAMLWAAPFAPCVLSWPGDTPWPPADLVCRLSGVGGTRVVCAASGGRRHPVVALWPVTLAETLADWLARGGRQVTGFAESVGLEVVEWPSPPDPFHNLNRPADVAEAERLLASPHSA